MDDVAVFFEHVYFFDGLDGLHVELFERGLQFFVVGARAFVHFFHLSSRRAFASGKGPMCQRNIARVLRVGRWPVTRVDRLGVYKARRQAQLRELEKRLTLSAEEEVRPLQFRCQELGWRRG